MNKYIIIILFKIIIVLFNYCNAASTLQQQLDAVKLLLETCDVNNNLNHSRFNNDELCSYDPYVYCDGVSITQLIFDFGGECTINDQVSIFNDLIVFKSDSGIKITDKFFTSISKFSYINEIDIENVVSFPSIKGFKLPTSLEYVTVSTNSSSVITPAFFESNIVSLQITSTNYIQPVITKQNFEMEKLTLNINSNAKLENEIGQYLTSLSTIKINSYGLNTIIPSSYLRNLNTLYASLFISGHITFDNGLQLLGDYNSMKVYMNNVVLGKCSVSPCHQFSSQTEIYIQDSDVYFNDFDYTNLLLFGASLTDGISVSIVNQLPSINNPSNLQLIITNYNNYVIGDIPDNYCNLESVKLQNNGLNGSIPSCFKCSSSAKQMILPNKFKDFNESSPTECPNFKIDNQDQIYVATSKIEEGYITITGKDLGWGIDVFRYSPARPISNKEIQIPVPGVGIESDTIQVEFHDKTISVALKYAFAPPVIESYETIHNQIIFYGYNFDLFNPNVVTIGEHVVDFVGLYRDAQQIAYDDKSVFEFKEGSKYQVSVTTAGQESSTFELYYIESVSYPNDIYKLSLSGGQLQLTSTFSYIPKDYSIITCKVTTSNSASQNCTVNSITEESTTITYPKSNKESSAIITLNIGGRVFQLNTAYKNNDDSISISTSKLNNINFIILISSLIITIISTI